MPALAACCGLAAIVGLGLWTAERSRVRDLEHDRTQTAAALDQSKLQIQDLTNRLNVLAEKSEQTPPPAPVRPSPWAVRPSRRAGAAAGRKRAPVTATDPRVDRLQGELADTQQQLASTRDELSQDKEELDATISSARDDLSGSIAKTHDDVVELQKRGERNIYEFKLTKSKAMQRVGPLSVSLRGASGKHKDYDLAMVVDDNALSKKHINLYEPVWVTVGNNEAVELVANHVAKNEIEGYVSEPKYKQVAQAASSDQTPAPQQQLMTRDPGNAKQ